jgi:hypothetical protein
VEWHLHPGHNTVSLTGAAHTTDLYRRVPGGWTQPPAGRWPDHFMWEKFLRVPGVRAATATRATTVKAPAATHATVDADGRGANLQAWWDRMHAPGFRARWDLEVLDAVRRSAIEMLMAQQILRDHLGEQSDRIAEERRLTAAHLANLEAADDALRSEVGLLRAAVDRAEAEARDARTVIDEMQATRTWRLHDRLATVPVLRRLLARPLR